MRKIIFLCIITAITSLQCAKPEAVKPNNTVLTVRVNVTRQGLTFSDSMLLNSMHELRTNKVNRLRGTDNAKFDSKKLSIDLRIPYEQTETNIGPVHYYIKLADQGEVAMSSPFNIRIPAGITNYTYETPVYPVKWSEILESK